MMGLPATHGYLVGPVGANDQDTAVTRLAAEMNQQAAGSRIHPVQVFEDQHEWPLPGNCAQCRTVLGQDRLLCDPRARLGIGERYELLEPGRITLGKGRRSL